jgi:quinol monooxygenase YgiN
MLLIAVLLGIQAPPEPQFHAVVYVEVAPASKSGAIGAFGQYVDSSRKEAGFVRFEFFEQTGRPGHLVLIETWSDQKAMEAHAAAAHTKEWRSKLDAIRLSDYDQRPYRTITAGASKSNDRSTFVISHVDIGGQGTNAPELLRKQAEASRAENGNQRFDVYQHAVRANHFTVIEAWEDQGALDRHAAAPHTRQYREALGPITGSPIDERIYAIVGN